MKRYLTFGAGRSRRPRSGGFLGGRLLCDGGVERVIPTTAAVTGPQSGRHARAELHSRHSATRPLAATDHRHDRTVPPRGGFGAGIPPANPNDSPATQSGWLPTYNRRQHPAAGKIPSSTRLTQVPKRHD